MKRDWSDGYVADVTYSHGYFHELAPAYLRYHLLANGYALPSDGGAYTYCELGFGQGVSALLHAAANPRGEFWGTDFNPSHALNVQTLSRKAGLNAHWHDMGFEAFLDSSTPQFDFVVLHGVWSWVSPAAQHSLVEFMRRKLKPGGVVFISYNVLPGWNAEKPLRDLLWMHTHHGSAASAATPVKIAAALEFARNLRRHGCAFFTENVRASQALDDMLRQDPASLAHEYFNESWWLTYFADVERALQAASMGFACSVHMSDIAGEVRDRLAGAGFVDETLGPVLRETAADFVLSRRFRRDVFTKGAIRLSPVERLSQFDGLKFTLMRPVEDIAMVVTTPYGRLPMDESKVRPLLEAMNASAAPVSFARMRTQAGLDAIHPDELIDILSTLVARRDVCPVFADDAAVARTACASRLNAVLGERAAFDNSVRYLASPVAGSAVEAGRHDRLFWLGLQRGAKTAAELARLALPPDAHGDSEALEDVEKRAQQFLAVTVPVWRRLGLFDAAQPPKARK
jgi:SAM-dependent methyltransferase